MLLALPARDVTNVVDENGNAETERQSNGGEAVDA